MPFQNMPMSADKTMRLFSGRILPRNESYFTCSHLKKFPGEKTLPTGAGQLKAEGKEWERKGLKGSNL